MEYKAVAINLEGGSREGRSREGGSREGGSREGERERLACNGLPSH